jgi:hypothetical protein
MNIAVRLWHIAVSILGISFAFEGSVHAKLITIQFSGTVTLTSGPDLPDSIDAGDLFTGTYFYESSTRDSDALPSRGMYQHDALAGIRVTLGEYQFKTVTDSGYFMQIWNNQTDYHGSQYDSYYIGGGKISAPPNMKLCQIHWDLIDNTHTALASDALPVSAPVLSDWNLNHFQISSDNIFLIDGIITHAALVPEPATLLLIGLGRLLIRRRV